MLFDQPYLFRIKLIILCLCLYSFSIAGKVKLSHSESFNNLFLERGIPNWSDLLLMETDSSEIERIYAKGKYYYSNNEIDSALFYYSKIMDLPIDTEKNNMYYKVKSNYGVILKETGRLTESINLFRNLIEDYSSNEDLKIIFLVELYKNLALALGPTGKTDSTIVVCKSALTLLNGINPESSTLEADLYSTLGIMYYYKSLYDQSGEYILKGLNINLELKEEADEEIASGYGNLGVIYKVLGNYKKALVFYEKSLKIRKVVFKEEHPSFADIYGNIGNLYSDMGQEERALDYHFKALSIREKAKDEHIFNIAGIYNNIATSYSKQKEFDKAMVFHKKAIDFYTLNNQEKHPTIADKYTSMAISFKEQKKYDQAIEILLKNNQLILEILSKKNRTYLLNNLTLAEVYLKRKEFDKALTYSNISLVAAKESLGDKNIYTIMASLVSGLTYMEMGEYDQAKIHFLETIKANAPGMVSVNMNRLPSPEKVISGEYYIYTLSGLVNVCKKSVDVSNDPQKLYEILPVLHLGDKVLDNLSRNNSNFSDQFLFQEKLFDFYKDAVDISYLLYEDSKDIKYLEEAHYFIEKSKYNIFLYRVNDESILDFELIPDSLKSLENDLKVNISFYETKVPEQHYDQPADSSEEIKEYENRLFSLKEEYQQLMNHFETSYPEYFDLKYNSRIKSHTLLQASLKDSKSTILQYYLTDDFIYISGINDSTILFQKTALPDGFSESLIKYRSFHQSVSMKPKDIENFNKLSYELYQLLVKDFEPLISSSEHLVIVPDDQLGLIPFETLQSKMTNNQIPAYLINEISISYINSSSVLHTILEDHSQSDDYKLLAFAPSFFNPESDSSINQPKKLKWSESEIKAANKYYSGEVVYGLKARKSLFKENASEYKIIHLATHGIINDEKPMLSKLLFAPENEDSNKYLFTKELFDMRIPAELVVLSACESGAGKIIKGEGVVSLAKGFFYAGTKSVMMSLWRTSDRSSAIISESFYKHLAAGKRKDTALKLAKQEYLAKSKGFESHPFFWSQYVINGDMKPIKNTKNNTTLFIILSLISLVMIVFFLKRKSIFRS